MQMAANRYRWVVLAVAWTSCLIVYLTRLAIGPLAPFLKEAFALSNAQVGSLLSASVVTYAPTMIVAGWLVDRVGVHRMLVVGTLITSLCVLTIFLFPSYTVLLVALLLTGLGTGCIFPSTIKALVLWFSRRERATAVGLNQTAVNMGGILGATILPSVALAVGWRYGFLVVAVMGFSVCLGSAILYRNPPRDVAPAGENPAGAATSPVSSTRLTLKLFRSRDIWMLGLAGLFLCVVEYSAMTHMVLFLKEGLGFSAVAAGGLLAMTEAAGALGKPASGVASDRLFGGNRKAVFLIMAAASGAISFVLAAFSRDPGWLLYPMLVILGMMAIGWGGLYATMAGELGGKELAGVAAGASAAVVIVGAVIGPPLFGYVVDGTGSYGMAWLVMGIFATVAVVAVALLREPARQA